MAVRGRAIRANPSKILRHACNTRERNFRVTALTTCLEPPLPAKETPGYPKRGTYRMDGRRLILAFDAGGADEALHIVRGDSRVLLLTDEQFRAFEQSATHDECVLARTGH